MMIHEYIFLIHDRMGTGEVRDNNWNWNYEAKVNESVQIVLVHEIRPFMLTQTCNLSSKY